VNANHGTVQGFCKPEFAEVEAEFHRNFAERGELGASVSIIVEGKLCVDLWGGVADQASGRAWEQDTIAPVFSATKGLSAICMHLLIDRGLLDIDAPVARYWPEFAANGKRDITVAMVLSHQAGLPVWQELLPEAALYDWNLVASRLAAEAAIWEPGTCHGYHAATLGVLEGELVRRITGKTIGALLRAEVAERLGADVWVGLPESEEERVATVYLSELGPQSPLFQKLTADKNWFGWKMMGNCGNDVTHRNVNSRRRHAAELPAIGGIASARGLAQAYAPLSLDGSIDGIRLVDKSSLPAMRAVRSASDRDLVLQVPTTFTLGFSKSWGDRRLGEGEHVIIGEQAFGTPGMGGSLGFADGEARMSFGYVMNKHGPGVGLNDRGQSLVDAAYRAVQYSSSEPGFWVR
jgi:CubicO group peptidase (beta-lactamase class C family)